MDREINTRLKITPDPQNRQAVADIQNLRKEIILTAKEAERASREAERATAKAAQAAKKAQQEIGQKGVRAGAALGQFGAIGGAGGIGQAGSAISQISSSFGALGPVAAVASGAVIALGLGLKALNDAAKEGIRQTELALAQANAEIDAKHLSTEQINKMIEEQTRVVEDSYAKSVAAFNELGEARENERKGIGGAIKDMLDEVNLFSDATNTAEEAQKEATKAQQDAEAKLKGLKDALKSTEVAANNAADAAKKLAEELTEALLDSASDAGEAIKFETDALNRSAEANLDRIDAIDAERRALEAELKILEESGDTSKKVTDKIAGLNEKLSDLGVEADTINTVLPSVQDSEARQQAAEDAAEAHKQAAKTAADSAKKRREEAKREAEERLKDQIDYENELRKVAYDGAMERYQIMVDSNREQDRLLREQQQNFKDLMFSQDFLGMFSSLENLSFQLREAQIASGQSLSDSMLQQAISAQQTTTQYNSTQQTNNLVFPNAGQSAMFGALQQVGVI